MEEQTEIKQLMTELLEKMGFTNEVTVTQQENLWMVQIAENEESPLLIGKFGMTLRSLQTILETALFKKLGKKVELAVNIGDYRERQKERLEEIAENVATRVKAEHRPASLRSFSAYERKLIHEYISQKHPDLRTTSMGEGKERRLIISLASDDTSSLDPFEQVA